MKKIAIVHDFLNQQGGAEYVVAVLHEMFPEAPIYTSFYFPDKTWPIFKNANIKVSWMQNIPFINKHFKKLFFLYPFAFRSFNLKDYDVIISSCSAFGKSIKVRKGQKHICYLHTPPRFLYRTEEYVKKEGVNIFYKFVLPLFLAVLRVWDKYTNKSVTLFVANSKNIQNRIKNIYKRDSIVIYPPVDLDRFPASDIKDDFYLIISRLVGYKRIDLAVKAFNKLGDTLVVIGSGSDYKNLKKMASPNIEIMGFQKDEVVEAMINRCKAFIFPGEEDFGITPVEAQAAGKPVIAFKAGGALETVIDGETGVFFEKQNEESLCNAISDFKKINWSQEKIRNNAEKFSKNIFIENIKKIV
jgi:glycosyltransferase involved in cell wall biosynthesis